VFGKLRHALKLAPLRHNKPEGEESSEKTEAAMVSGPVEKATPAATTVAGRGRASPTTTRSQEGRRVAVEEAWAASVRAREGSDVKADAAVPKFNPRLAATFSVGSIVPMPKALAANPTFAAAAYVGADYWRSITGLIAAQRFDTNKARDAFTAPLRAREWILKFIRDHQELFEMEEGQVSVHQFYLGLMGQARVLDLACTAVAEDADWKSSLALLNPVRATVTRRNPHMPGWCYGLLFVEGERQDAMEALQAWPTVDEVRDYSLATGVDYAYQLAGKYDAAGRRFHVDRVVAAAPYPPVTYLMPGGHARPGQVTMELPLDTRIGGEDTAVVVGVPDTPLGSVVAVSWIFTANDSACVTLEDMVAAVPALCNWSSVRLVGVSASVESTDVGTSVALALGRCSRGTNRSPGSGRDSLVVTRGDVTRCEQRVFTAGTQTNAGGATALLRPDARIFDLELSGLMANTGPPRPYLCYVVQCPTNEVVRIELEFAVSGGATVEGRLGVL
jgi:hypothetical protein